MKLAPPATELPLEYREQHPNHDTPLMQAGEIQGIFVSPIMREQTRQFLAKSPGGAKASEVHP